MLGHPAYSNLSYALEQSIQRSEPYAPFSPEEPFSWTRALLDRLPNLDGIAVEGWSDDDRCPIVVDDDESFRGFIRHLVQRLEEAELLGFNIGVSRYEIYANEVILLIWTSL